MTRDQENKLIEIASRWEWMRDLLDGKEVSDFALSFPEVQKLDDIMRAWRKEMTEVIEKLAALEHEQWAHWTKYMLTKLGEHSNSANADVRRWWRQIETPYADLSEKEKESDREWARKVLEVVND